MAIVYLGLGANLGETRKTLQEAIASLAHQVNIVMRAQSSFYRSAPVNAEGEDYTNCVVEIKTLLRPRSLLSVIAALEGRFGRARPYPNAPRTLDIDILLYGAECMNEIDLIIPHPRLTERAFVLQPLLELAPEIEIPQRGRAAEFLQFVSGQRISKIVESVQNE